MVSHIFCRVDSRVRDCGIYALFAALAPNFKLSAQTVTLNGENWRIAVLSVRIRVSLNSGEFRLFPTFSVSLVLRTFRD